MASYTLLIRGLSHRLLLRQWKMWSPPMTPEVIRGTLGTLSMLGPYGSGRVLSMFRSKIDSLTIQYRDDNGGLHGVVFTMPVGTAESFKQQLIAQGAHTTIPAPANASVESPHQVAAEEKQ